MKTKQQKSSTQESIDQTKNDTAAENKFSREKFTVKTKGYQETFGDLNSAKSQYEVLKKRSVKSQESIKLELFSINEKGERTEIENVTIGEGFFK